MSIDVAGRCRCGGVTFVLLEEPISFYLCHCTDCQKESGSAFGQTMHVRRKSLTEITGTIQEHTIERPDGGGAYVAHCTNCLTIMWGGRPEIPQVVGVNAGSLDDVAGLTPYGNMWTQSARPWVRLAPGPCFERNPDDPMAMIHAWQGRPDRV